MQKRLNILMVEDSEDDALLLERAFKKDGIEAEFTRVDTQEALRSALSERSWDIVLCDYSIPHYSGMTALRTIREMAPDLPVIFVSGTIGEEVAVEAMRAGANDYLMKDNLTRLVPAVERELRDAAGRVERRRAEAALRESEERYRALFENSPLPIWEEDLSAVKELLDGLKEKGVDDIEAYLRQHPEVVRQCAERVRVTDVNRAALAMHEARDKEELLKGLMRTFTPESYATFQRALEGLYHGETEMALDSVVQTLSGKRRQVTAFFSVLPPCARAPFRVLVSLVDITALKETERRLAMFRALIDRTTDAIEVVDPETGRFLDVNEKSCEAHGYTREEFLGMTVFDVETKLDPADMGFWQNTMQAVRSAGSKPVEGWHRRKDGSTFPVEVNVNWVHLDRDYLVTVVRDITERKRAEEALRKLSRAVEQSPASIIITNAAGAIEYVNPKFTKLTGYSQAEALGRNPRLLKSGKTSDEEYRQLWQTITSGKEWRGEFHNRKKNGDLYWEMVSISPIFDSAGVITHFVAVKEDITEQKRLEEELRQSQKLEAVGQLAGGVAHDFNNILTAILMNLNLLKDDARLTPEMLAGLRELEQEANRAASLTRQLLVFSRRQVMDAKALDLNEIINHMTKMLRRLIGEDIDLVFQGQGASLWVMADAGMMDQVLMNLCVNARDAMPQGGQLTIGTRRILIDEESARLKPEAHPGVFICLSVTDTGCGMDEETRKHVFEPFFTTKEVGKGTGLGLATVYGIVNQHHGWIAVESALGKGTAFDVYLPALPEPGGNPDAVGPVEIRGGTETILLVEDDPGLRRLASLSLRKLGYTVLEAENGAEAMELWEQHSSRIDLLFSDMVMPAGFTGIDLAERFRKDKPALRVIVTSGYAADKAKPDQLIAKGIVFVAKPYEAVDLAGAVRSCLDQPLNRKNRADRSI